VHHNGSMHIGHSPRSGTFLLMDLAILESGGTGLRNMKQWVRGSWNPGDRIFEGDKVMDRDRKTGTGNRTKKGVRT